jgi:hypothetical protein
MVLFDEIVIIGHPVDILDPGISALGGRVSISYPAPLVVAGYEKAGPVERLA